MTNGLRITIITPSLNRAGMIADALDSVRAQNYPNVRHVVVDGVSTDGTLDILRARGDIELIVGRDQNLYHALNRGLSGEIGDVVGFLNTDDRLAPGALRHVAQMFLQAPETQVVSGAIAIERDNEREMVVMDHERFLALDPGNLINGPTMTNSRFMRSDLLREIGPFDTRFPVVSDRDFLIRAYHATKSEAVTRQVLYIYCSHPGSLTMAVQRPSQALAKAMREAATVRARETAGTAIGRIYARWAAWAQFYEGALKLKDEPSASALGGLLGAAAWSPAGLVRQLLRTLADRRLRQGRRLPLEGKSWS